MFYGHPTGEVLFKTGAGSNYGRYSDPKADELIDRTVVSDDLGALYEYQDYIAEQVPVIWTPGFPLRLFEVDNDLRGFEPVNPYGMINPENWYYVEDRANPPSRMISRPRVSFASLQRPSHLTGCTSAT